MFVPPLGRAITPPLMRLGSVTTPGTFAIGASSWLDRDRDNSVRGRLGHSDGWIQCAADLSLRPSSGAIASGGSFENPCGATNNDAGCGPIRTWLSSQRIVETLPFGLA